MNDVNSNSDPHLPLFPPIQPGVLPSGTIWHGGLAELDGMGLTVRRDRGRLTDRAGRLLWSGVVLDPPDDIITSADDRSGVHIVTVRTGQGKMLWSGLAEPRTYVGLEDDRNLRVIGPNQTVV